MGAQVKIQFRKLQSLWHLSIGLEGKAWERAKMMAEEEDDFDDVVDESEGGHSGEGLVGDMGLSDSLIPQVGDSFCERSQLLDDEKLLQGTEEENETDNTKS